MLLLKQLHLCIRRKPNFDRSFMIVSLLTRFPSHPLQRIPPQAERHRSTKFLGPFPSTLHEPSWLFNAVLTPYPLLFLKMPNPNLSYLVEYTPVVAGKYYPVVTIADEEISTDMSGGVTVTPANASAVTSTFASDRVSDTGKVGDNGGAL